MSAKAYLNALPIRGLNRNQLRTLTKAFSNISGIYSEIINVMSLNFHYRTFYFIEFTLPHMKTGNVRLNHKKNMICRPVIFARLKNTGLRTQVLEHRFKNTGFITQVHCRA